MEVFWNKAYIFFSLFFNNDSFLISVVQRVHLSKKYFIEGDFVELSRINVNFTIKSTEVFAIFAEEECFLQSSIKLCFLIDVYRFTSINLKQFSNIVWYS